MRTEATLISDPDERREALLKRSLPNAPCTGSELDEHGRRPALAGSQLLNGSLLSASVVPSLLRREFVGYGSHLVIFELFAALSRTSIEIAYETMECVPRPTYTRSGAG